MRRAVGAATSGAASRLGIRTWLVLLVATAVLPGGVFLARGFVAGRASLTTSTEKELRRTAALAADRVSAMFERAHGTLATLGTMPEVHARHGRQCSESARRIIHSEPGFLNIAVADEDGAVFCSGFATTSGVRVDDRAYFRRAMLSDDLVVGTFAVSRVARHPTLHVAHAVYDARGRRSGVALAELDLQYLDGLLASVAAPGQVLTIIDGAGTVVTRHPHPAGWIGSRQDAPVVERMLAGDESAEVAGLDGVVRMYAFSAVRAANAPTDLRVAAGVGREYALAPVARALRRSILAYGVVGTLGLLTAWLVGEFALTRRLDGIRNAARRLTTGDLRARSGVGGRDGVGQLARSFDEMAASLEELTYENRLVLEFVGVGIYGVNRDGGVTFVNPAAAELLGYPPAELVGMDAHAVLHAHGENPPRALGCALLAAIEDARVHSFDGVVFRRRDGRTFPVEIVCSPIRKDGNVVGAVTAFRDVTNRTRLELQLRHVQKMEAVGRLAGGVAHDFNNLLTVIMSAGQSIADGVSHGSADVRADAEEVLTAAARAAALTKQLLAFSRVQPVGTTVVDANALVANWQKLLDRLLGDDVETAIALAAAGRIRIDPGQLEQVLMNLAVNARDAMPEGGKLTIETADVLLDDSSTRGRLGVPAGRYVMVAVSDTGVGMDDDTLSQIFEPFFTTKAPGKGTGLGLSTVWGIVKQNGGDVQVYSAVGRGTTFKVYLPAVDAEPVTPTARPPVRDLRGRETVLLVEDDDQVREVAARALRRAGYKVVDVANPSEALRIAESGQPFDVLVTDVMMPELSGPELADRAREARPSSRVLFMSGYTGAALAQQRILRRDAAFLEKPFAAEALLRAVRDALDNARAD